MQTLEPLRFKPIYQNYIWGGNRIREKFQRVETPYPCAESWEVSDRSDAMSIVAEGRFAGETLNDLIGFYGEKLLGRGRKEKRFPLLIKLIDAKENLSVQVHPSNESADSYGGEPKTEAWVFLEGGPIYAGFKHPIHRKELLHAIEEKRVQDLLQKVDAKPGEIAFIPGGRIHAIGAGCMMLEVQQNSNSTFRVYDWARPGEPRPLHIKEALQCLKLDDTNSSLIQPISQEESSSFRCTHWLDTIFFKIAMCEFSEKTRIDPDPETFQIFFDVKRGETTLLPAESEPLEVDAGTYVKVSQAPT